MKAMRWFRRGNMRKFEDYTAWSLYLLLVMRPLIMAQWNKILSRSNPTLTTVFWVLVVAETVLAVVVIHDGVVALREQRPPRLRFSIAIGAIAVATLVVATIILRASDDNSGDLKRWIPLIVIGYAVGVGTASVPIRRVYATVAVALVLVGAGWRLSGITDGNLLVNAVFLTLFFALVVISVRASIAMLRLMHEIDRSRAVASRLAVAEERLRFARDLHDTLGRNLSAMALKSQLAKQLATRDADASAREMSAVQQLAEESLTEMRAVVQGYRDVDLSAELRGAQSLLRSANVASEINLNPAALPKDLHNGVGWVVREAVTNVIRHSTASTCTIQASTTDSAVTIRISNNHPNPAQAPDSGTGISGLGQRIAPLGGTLATQHTDDGFVLSAKFDRARGGGPTRDDRVATTSGDGTA